MDEPFQLTIRLRSPVIFSGFHLPTLDAVLAAARYRQTGSLAEMLDIPLKRTGDVFHGSVAMVVDPPAQVLQSRMYVLYRALRGQDMDIAGVQFPKTIDPARDETFQVVASQYATYFTAAPATKRGLGARSAGPALTLVYDGCGDGEACAALLADFLLGIGKRAGRGFGEIAPNGVGDPMEREADYSLKGPDGSPRRPIPVTLWAALGGAPDQATEEVSYYPPYNESPRSLCVMPPALMRLEAA